MDTVYVYADATQLPDFSCTAYEQYSIRSVSYRIKVCTADYRAMVCLLAAPRLSRPMNGSIFDKVGRVVSHELNYSLDINQIYTYSNERSKV